MRNARAMGKEAARHAVAAPRVSRRALALGRSLLRDVAGRWTRGTMGRGRWLLLAPLTFVLAGAAFEDVSRAGGPLDTVGRVLTATLLGAMHLNVAAKRLRDLSLGGWPTALLGTSVLAVSLLMPGVFGILFIAAALVMFLVPGQRAKAARWHRRSGPPAGENAPETH